MEAQAELALSVAKKVTSQENAPILLKTVEVEVVGTAQVEEGTTTTSASEASETMPEEVVEIVRAGHLAVVATSATRKGTLQENAQGKEMMVALVTPTSAREERTVVMAAQEVVVVLLTESMKLLREERTGETGAGPEEVPVLLKRAKYAEVREKEEVVPGAIQPTRMVEDGEQVIALKLF